MIDYTSPPGSYADKFRDAPWHSSGLAYRTTFTDDGPRIEFIDPCDMYLDLASAASQLARHGAEQRREKIVTKAKAIAERMNRPDLVERLTR